MARADLLAKGGGGVAGGNTAAEPALGGREAVAGPVLHEGFQGSANHGGLASLILDRQPGGHGTLHRRMGL